MASIGSNFVIINNKHKFRAKSDCLPLIYRAYYIIIILLIFNFENLQQGTMKTARAITESLVVLAVVLIANVAFGSADPGWLGLNPSPYLLVPLLLGARYGIAPGLLGGILAAVAALVYRHLVLGGNLVEAFRVAPFMMLALPAVGLVTGEVQRYLSHRIRNAEHLAQKSETDARRLEADLSLAQESQVDLQEQLALHGAEFCAADIELRKLFGGDAGPLLPGVLSALEKLADVSAAAFYVADEEGVLTLEAMQGDAGAFPTVLSEREGRIALKALQEEKLVTCRGLWEDGGAVPESFIAALPWGAPVAGPLRRVLVIAEMPFLAINWSNLARVEVFCSWVAEMDSVISTAGGEVEPVGAPELRRFLGIASETVARQGVPSTLLLFTIGTGVINEFEQSAIDSVVMSNLHVGDIAARFERPDPHIAVLLPMRGSREAGQLVRAVERAAQGEETSVRCESYPIDRPGDADELWRRLSDVA